jgi:indole-3-glycerol phosphate synthase
MPNILEKIVATKRQEIEQAKSQLPLSDLQELAGAEDKPRQFKAALRQRTQQQLPAVIAEIKQASPSKGLLTNNFDPLKLATDYSAAGASCISVLTDVQYFRGDSAYIKQVKQVSKLPVLRKDFIIDTYQVYQSRHIGADAILLIAAILDKRQLHEYNTLAQQLGLAVLVEVHNLAELQLALELDGAIIGINNRNLTTFATDVQVTIDLLPHIPQDKVVVTESGIHTRSQVETFLAAGVYGFLVGESLVKAANLTEKFNSLFN